MKIQKIETVNIKQESLCSIDSPMSLKITEIPNKKMIQNKTKK